jgi:hypothetical protein
MEGGVDECNRDIRQLRLVSGLPTIRSKTVGSIGRGQLLLTLQVKFAASLVLPVPL